MGHEEYIEILKTELIPALGCTEPIAIAYAAAKAKNNMGCRPEKIQVLVSRNILKNAMGVGIPGTGAVGLEMAAALGAIGGDSDAVLKVLSGVTEEDIEEARTFSEQYVEVALKDTVKKLYIEVTLYCKEESASVVIEDSHTNITKMTVGQKIIYENEGCIELVYQSGQRKVLTVDGIYDFVQNIDIEKLNFLSECIKINSKIARYGLKGQYGLQVGKSVCDSIKAKDRKKHPDYPIAMTAAAADARMSGCTLPVMTVCGSGNQGITATIPVIETAKSRGYSQEILYRALALSCLITIHVKSYIGKLSPLCGCGMGSSIGTCCAYVFMEGGTLEQIKNAIRNMIADVSGIICDGAKAGCALKIATVTASAYRCSVLALKDFSAGGMDGIVSEDVEETIRNLGILCNQGMADADRVILDMMIS